MDIFRTDSENDLFSNVAALFHRFGPFCAQYHVLALKMQHHLAVFLRRIGGNHVHLGRTDESGHEFVAGMVIKVLRRINLLHHAVFHHHDSRSQCHGLGLIMGYVNDGGTQSLMKLGNLHPHLSP